MIVEAVAPLSLLSAEEPEPEEHMQTSHILDNKRNTMQTELHNYKSHTRDP